MDALHSARKGKIPIRNIQNSPIINSSQSLNAMNNSSAEQIKREEAAISSLIQPARNAVYPRMARTQPTVDGDDVLLPLMKLLQHAKKLSDTQNSKPVFFIGDRNADEAGIQSLEARETRFRAYLQVVCAVDEQLLKKNFEGTQEERQRLVLLLGRRQSRLQAREQEPAVTAALRVWEQFKATKIPPSTSNNFQQASLATPSVFDRQLQQNIATPTSNVASSNRLQGNMNSPESTSRFSTWSHDASIPSPQSATPTRSGRNQVQTNGMGPLDSFNASAEVSQGNSSNQDHLATSQNTLPDIGTTTLPASFSFNASTPMAFTDSQPAFAPHQFDINDIIDWNLVGNGETAELLKDSALPADIVQNNFSEDVATTTNAINNGSFGSAWQASDAARAMMAPVDPISHFTSSYSIDASPIGLQEQIAQTPVSGRKRNLADENELDVGGSDQSKRRKASGIQQINPPIVAASQSHDQAAEIQRLRAIIESLGKDPNKL